MSTPASTLPTLMAIAWLLPLASFVIIVFIGKFLGHGGKGAGYVSVAAIVASCIISLYAMIGVWLPNHPVSEVTPHEAHEIEHSPGGEAAIEKQEEHDTDLTRPVPKSDKTATGESAHAAHAREPNPPPKYYYGDWYTL